MATDAARQGRVATGTESSDDGRLGQAALPVRRGRNIERVIVLSAPLDDVEANVDLVRERILVAGGIALAIALAAGTILATRMSRRIKRLEDAGLITKRVTLLNAQLLGLDFEVYAIVKLMLPSSENLDAFEAAVSGWPEVVQCATVTGRDDYVLRVITSDMHAFDLFLREKLLALGIVSDCESHIVTRGVKNVTALPLGIVTPHVG